MFKRLNIFILIEFFGIIFVLNNLTKSCFLVPKPKSDSATILTCKYIFHITQVYFLHQQSSAYKETLMDLEYKSN